MFYVLFVCAPLPLLYELSRDLDKSQRFVWSNEAVNLALTKTTKREGEKDGEMMGG